MPLAPFHRLPPRLPYALADAAADATYALWTPGRRRIRENLRVVLGTDDVATLDYWGQRQLRRYGEYCLEALWPRRADAGRLRRGAGGRPGRLGAGAGAGGARGR